MTTYIFGYGSLMNSASRQLTGQTSPAIPANVKGLVRYWSKIDDSYVLSPLIVNQGDGQVNGVLLAIEQAALRDFDTRERGYHRLLVSPNDIECEFALNESDDIWVYVKDTPEPPCNLVPIMQTYVDTVLSGCLEISEAFAKQFVEQTIGWHFPRENDRHSPKYGNFAGVNEIHQSKVDALLQQLK